MSKFKVGDRVVFIDKTPHTSFHAGITITPGMSGIVYALVDNTDYNKQIRVDFSGKKLLGLHASSFMLEEIYNSPLYKVLKESSPAERDN